MNWYSTYILKDGRWTEQIDEEKLRRGYGAWMREQGLEQCPCCGTWAFPGAKPLSASASSEADAPPHSPPAPAQPESN